MFTIPSDTTIIGELRSAGRMQIDGHIEGNGNIDGFLLLSKSGVWKGSVTADFVVVEGTIEGDVVARSKLELMPSARVKGRVISPAISIAEGARVDGELRMKSEPAVGLFVHKKEQKETEVQTLAGDRPKQAAAS